MRFRTSALIASASVPVGGRGVRVIVYTRFDGSVVDPLEAALFFGRASDARIPAVDLYLYNNIGSSTQCFHYDHVLRDVRRAGREVWH